MDRRNAAIQVTQQMEPKKERMMIEWGEEARQQRRKSEREPDTPSERERERKEMSNNRGPGGRWCNQIQHRTRSSAKKRGD